jgi:hypothetical protein
MTTTAPVSSPFLTQEEAAAWLRVTVAALQKWRRMDIGPPCYRPVPNGKVLFKADELSAWVEAGALTRALEAEDISDDGEPGRA